MDTNERGAITVPDVLMQLFGAPFDRTTFGTGGTSVHRRTHRVIHPC